MIFTEAMRMGGLAVEIGPIGGIRPVTMVNSAQREADLKGVFAVELRRQGENESYSPSQKASRGLEEDDAEEDAAREEEHAAAGSAPHGSINFFA